jgi:hypothetical protein
MMLQINYWSYSLHLLSTEEKIVSTVKQFVNYS